MGDPAPCECISCGRLHRFLGNPPWALTPHDLRRLSLSFNQVSDLRTTADQRINEWLKRLITQADAEAQSTKATA